MSWDISSEDTNSDNVHLYDYDIPATDYARPDPLNPKRCIIYVKGSTDELNHWELGTTFARSHCISIDYYVEGDVSVALKKQ
ncbi:hypothetical protein AAVH_25481 [Aphelenchoides avenae]|nr:hypothetical protein AAVH_36417 [Aphelenchus avenae]KAH7707292.1 hypothetical protein AAVH_25481 [Aphelenchus avenae]